MATREHDAQVSSKKEFDALALDGYNFPTWAMDLKVSLLLRGMFKAIEAPKKVKLHCLNQTSIMPYSS
jgi:hypothetical protein